jgi:hypothetical protein
MKTTLNGRADVPRITLPYENGRGGDGVWRRHVGGVRGIPSLMIEPFSGNNVEPEQNALGKSLEYNRESAITKFGKKLSGHIRAYDGHDPHNLHKR